MKNSLTSLKPLPPKKSRKPLRDYAKYTNLAIEMLVIIGVGIFGGVKLDQWLELKFPVFTLILSVLSFSAAIYYAIKDFIRK